MMILREPSRILNYIDLLEEKSSLPDDFSDQTATKYLQSGRLEFHPTNLCNLNCDGCIEGGKNRANNDSVFPVKNLEKLRAFDPKAIVLSGGGEPTLYTDNGCSFGDLVSELEKTFPSSKLGLITNGTFIPNGNWSHSINWLRISLDAADQKTYFQAKGKNYFHQVIENLLHYLDSDIQDIGVGFLFTDKNLPELVKNAHFIFKLIIKERPKRLGKVNIQFRPRRKDFVNLQLSNFKFRSRDTDSVEFKKFLKQQTNFQEILEKQFAARPHFKRCYYSHVSSLVRANGELRPCCVGIQNKNYVIGNILTDRPTVLARKKYKWLSRLPETCQPQYCIESSKNALLESELSTNIIRLPKYIKNNPFF